MNHLTSSAPLRYLKARWPFLTAGQQQELLRIAERFMMENETSGTEPCAPTLEKQLAGLSPEQIEQARQKRRKRQWGPRPSMAEQLTNLPPRRAR